MVVVEEKFLQDFAKPAQVKEGERVVARERPGVGAQPLTSIYRVRVELGQPALAPPLSKAGALRERSTSKNSPFYFRDMISFPYLKEI